MANITKPLWLSLFIGLTIFSTRTNAFTTESILPDCSAPLNANVNSCIRLFQNMATINQNSSPSNETMTYINSLVRKVTQRDVNKPWVRKEIRKLTPDEWNTYTDAINEMKSEVCVENADTMFSSFSLLLLYIFNE